MAVVARIQVVAVGSNLVEVGDLVGNIRLVVVVGLVGSETLFVVVSKRKKEYRHPHFVRYKYLSVENPAVSETDTRVQDNQFIYRPKRAFPARMTVFFFLIEWAQLLETFFPVPAISSSHLSGTSLVSREMRNLK